MLNPKRRIRNSNSGHLGEVIVVDVEISLLPALIYRIQLEKQRATTVSSTQSQAPDCQLVQTKRDGGDDDRAARHSIASGLGGSGCGGGRCEHW